MLTGKLTDKNSIRIIDEYGLKDHLHLESFKSKIDKEINGVIIQKVLEYVINIVTNYVDPTKLKLLYIAIDGVPLKSKMVEQRKRRYMGMTIEKIKEKIFAKYEDELKKDPVRYQFEKNKIRWSTINITPGTIFMDELVTSLTSPEFNKKLKLTCKRLEEYIFSGPYEPGEGEKKIVDHIRGQSYRVPDDYVIYSPDSDVTLLCLLLNTKMHELPKVSRLKILRHNQQKANYDVVDIDTLSDNLYNYIVKDVNIIPPPDKDSIINDVVFMLTIFGNDFVPKVQAFDVKNDFDRIIDKYVDLLKANVTDGKFKYIINHDHSTKNKKIDLPMFKGAIKLLKQDEGGNLQKIYITSHYQNYDKLKKIMGATHTTFTEVLNDFLSKLREMNNDLSKIDGKEFIDKWKNDEYVEFIDRMKRVTRLPIRRDATVDEFLKAYAASYAETKEYPRVAVYFRSYKQSLKSDFHQEKLAKTLDYLGPNMKITKYDEEIYKFDNMFDEYQKKLSAYKLNLGYVSIDPKTYTWKTAKIVDSVKRFYKEYFNIDDINVKHKKMKDLIYEYVRGLLWVFNFYFNGFNEDDNRRFGDAWFYPYNYAPLMTQIHEYLMTISDLDTDFDEFKVPRQEYFNCLEHLMYVSPAPSMLNIIPKEYRQFAENSTFYPDLDKIAEDVFSNPLSTGEIDCRGHIFLNKCHITQLHIERNFDNDIKFINELRRIKLSPETEKRSGRYKPDNSPNVNITIYNPKSEQARQYGAYKGMYLNTGEYKYKRLYKINKYKLMNLIE
jgi:5'-3' exonuclease